MKDNGVVIFFYPRANTPGCTVQACAFRDKTAAIEKEGYKIYGMSADRPRSQANWKKKQRLEYCLLCDPTYEVQKMYNRTKTLLFSQRISQKSALYF